MGVCSPDLVDFHHFQSIGTDSTQILHLGTISSVPYMPHLLKTYPSNLSPYAYTAPVTVLIQGHAIKPSR